MAQRMEVRLKRPNPAIEDLVSQWLADAEQRNTKAQYKLRDALFALKSYPIPLANGRECGILRGFSTTLCERIDAALRQQDVPAVLNNITFREETQQAAKRKSVSVVSIAPLKKPPPATKRKPKAKSATTLTAAATVLQPITMPAGSYRVLLLVDTQETSGRSKRSNNCQTCQYLNALNVPYEVRRLTLGDFVWVAQDAAGNELVLPYIVERKRMDDLASSIRDGRFHEQKHRLRQLPNVIYLVEDYGENRQLSLPLPTLRQAMVNTQVHAGFQIVHTENHYRSMAYLQQVTHVLAETFKYKELRSADDAENWNQCALSYECLTLPRFQHFYENSSRNAQLTVREIFVQQLVQLHSLSLKKALAIVQVYATPRLLFDAYDACVSVQEAQQLLAGIRYGELERPVGEKISQIVHDFYRTLFK